jgi:hypothetical protein
MQSEITVRLSASIDNLVMPVRKYTRVAAGHHLVRRCGYQVIDRDDATNKVRGLFPAAMRLREQINERYLSANWLEHCDGTKVERLKAIVAIHRAKAKTPPSLQSGVAVLNAGRILEIGIAHRRKLRVRHTPNPYDPSYSQISGLPLNNSDDLLIASLVEEAYQDFMLLRDLDALPWAALAYP